MNFNEELQEEPLISLDETFQNTSHTSGSGTTGRSWVSIHGEDETEGMRDRQSGGCVDQGGDDFDDDASTPHALYTPGESLPRTGYEPKPSNSLDPRGVDGSRMRRSEHTASTISVQCADGESGISDLQRIKADISTLDKKLQDLIIKEERGYMSVCNSLATFCTREEEEEHNCGLEKEILNVHHEITAVRFNLDDKFQDYMSIKEFQDIVNPITDTLNEFKGMLEKTRPEEEKRSNSPNDGSQSHIIQQIGKLYDELKNLKTSTTERIRGEIDTIRDRIVKEITESSSYDVKRIKTQHPGGASEDLLNHVLKASGDAHNLVSTLESKINRVEMNYATVDNIKFQFSNVEEKFQNQMNQCLGEIDNRIREQVNKVGERLSAGIEEKYSLVSKQKVDTLSVKVYESVKTD